MTVHSEHRQDLRVARPLNAWNILVLFLTHIGRFNALVAQVVDMNAHDRVFLTWFRIFEFVFSRVQVIEDRHRVFLYFTFVETEESDFLTIRAPEERLSK